MVKDMTHMPSKRIRRALDITAGALIILLLIGIIWLDITSGVWAETVILSGIAAGLLTFLLTALFIDRWMAAREHRKSLNLSPACRMRTRPTYTVNLRPIPRPQSAPSRKYQPSSNVCGRKTTEAPLDPGQRRHDQPARLRIRFGAVVVQVVAGNQGLRDGR